MKIKELAADDELAAFCSDDDRLDEWLKKHAIKNQERGFGTTYLALDNDGSIVGFVSTSAASVERARQARAGSGTLAGPTDRTDGGLNRSPARGNREASLVARVRRRQRTVQIVRMRRRDR